MRNSSLCYIERENSYLMLHRVKKENDVNRDKWIGVGGGFEEGESPYDCVKRETYEETGLTLLKPVYRGLVTFVYGGGEGEECITEQMHLFSCKDFCGELRPDCDEGVLEWVERSRLFDLELWEGDRLFLRMLDRDTPFFSLKLVYSKDDALKEAFLDGEALDVK